ncbi:Hypothetical protein NTJ_03762 [Nesidiocoris tenuis]|uniref:G-protein coupled receptors family 1 profile domain-containing protein n=2 Tax=Nesidiocoris tenuis TaxID=355587 RepID=A0ABN7AFE4_9HEMI|nr:Hypothetical protein NTJ_03762 [Nesidiocoris tenuis]
MNLYIFTIVFMAKQVRVESGGSTRMLLAQLGFIGFITSTTFLATNATSYLDLQPLLPCHVASTALMILHPMAMFNIAGLNSDRYLAIAAPLHYSSLVGPRKVLFIGAIAWLTTFTLALLPLTFTGFEPVESTASAGSGGAGGIEPEIQPSVTTPSSINIGYVCRPPVFCVVGGFAFVLFYTLITFLLPVGIVIFCNVNILMIARHHRHRIARAIFEVTLSAQVTITHQKNPFLLPQPGSASGRHRSANTTILQITISLFVFYGLNYVLLIAESAGVNVPDELYYTSTVLQAISPPYNAFLYGLKNKLLRRTFRNYWRKKMTKSELDQEILARTPSRRPSLTPQRFQCPNCGLGFKGFQETKNVQIDKEEHSQICSKLKVARPSSAGVISHTTPRLNSLRHSFTSASLMASHKVNTSSDRGAVKKRAKPMILVTKPGSIEDMMTDCERTRYKLGGSASSVSGDSDVTQEDWGPTTQWHLSASSASLPTRPDDLSIPQLQIAFPPPSRSEDQQSPVHQVSLA